MGVMLRLQGCYHNEEIEMEHEMEAAGSRAVLWGLGLAPQTKVITKLMGFAVWSAQKSEVVLHRH